MNVATIPYPSLGRKDFAGNDAANDLVAAARRFKIEMPLRVVSALSFAPFTTTGIAETVSYIVAGRSAVLSPSLRQRIAQLSQLDVNWDGEGAKAIKPYVLADVIEALKRFSFQSIPFREPFLAPAFDGFIQMEWHDKKRSLEIEAIDQGWSLVGTMFGNDGNCHYFTAECERSDFQRLEKFYEWFAGAELIWPSL
jgi:hypothetical protein